MKKKKNRQLQKQKDLRKKKNRIKGLKIKRLLAAW